MINQAYFEEHLFVSLINKHIAYLDFLPPQIKLQSFDHKSMHLKIIYKDKLLGNIEASE